jgi:hypothetical protein
MYIVRFTAGASAGALAGSTDGDRVVEFGAASVAELLAEPAVARWTVTWRDREAVLMAGFASAMRVGLAQVSAGGYQ